MKNLNTVFPFYDAVSEQYRYREDVENPICLTALSTTFVPFIIRTSHAATTAAQFTVDLYDFATNTKQTTYTWHGDDFGMVKIVGTSYDYFYFAATTVATPSLPTGQFYMTLTDTIASKVYYSETFAIVSSVANMLKLKFENTTTISNIAPNFNQVIYLSAILKTPEYLREDTGDKRNGILVKEKQVLIKSEAIRVITCPEYLVDALMLVPMMDTVTVTPPGGNETTYNEIRAKDPEWAEQSNGAYAKFELQLLTIMSIKKLNFKEMGYTEASEAVIKQGGGNTSVSGSDHLLAVTFTEDMPDDGYTVSAYCVGSTTFDVQSWYIPTQSVHGFTIQTPVACIVKWTAIHV